MPRAPALVSVVIPTLHEARWLPACLDALAGQPGPMEVIVADGGSRDGTTEAARAHPLSPRVVAAAVGRGPQMNAGARVARGGVLVFLHADTPAPAGRPRRDPRRMRRRRLGRQLDVRWDGPGRFGALLAAVAWLERRLGVFYGDSVIWARRDAFAGLGGFPDIPIMEDYALARRLVRSRRDRHLPGPVVTSSRRWRRLGIVPTVASWVVIRWAWLAGVPARALARLYPHAR